MKVDQEYKEFVYWLKPIPLDQVIEEMEKYLQEKKAKGAPVDVEDEKYLKELREDKEKGEVMYGKHIYTKFIEADFELRYQVMFDFFTETYKEGTAKESTFLFVTIGKYEKLSQKYPETILLKDWITYLKNKTTGSTKKTIVRKHVVKRQIKLDDIDLSKIQLPKKLTEQEHIEWLKENELRDTLRSAYINVENYGSIPVYRYDFYLLRKDFDIAKLPFEAYAKGYLDGFQTEFIPYIDTPEYRKELLINTVRMIQGFPYCYDTENGEDNEYIDSEAFYEYGLLIGKKRKAWDIILENSSAFKEFLNDRKPSTFSGELKNEIGSNTIKDQDYSLDQTNADSRLNANINDLSEIQNNFDGVEIQTVYNYFHKEMVLKNYFSANDILPYLKQAFDLKKIPEKKFDLNNRPSIQKIHKVFYKYYKDIAGKPTYRQKEYASLLGDYFTGFKTENVSTNFSK